MVNDGRFHQLKMWGSGMMLIVLATVMCFWLAGYRAFVVGSASMHPTLNIGTLVVTGRALTEDFHVGDIITFRVQRQVITHRVRAIRHADGAIRFLTRGDANTIDDPWEIPPQEIIGKVRLVLPLSWPVIEALRTQSYFTSAITANGNVITVQNGAMNDHAGWVTHGDVRMEESAGQPRWRLGRTENEGRRFAENTLSQTFPAGVTTLKFSYNIFTADYRGFDDPGFVVLVNDEEVFRVRASDVDRDAPLSGVEHVDSRDWQTVEVPLTTFGNKPVTITFAAGNDAANTPSTENHQTWVYVGDIALLAAP